MGEAVRITGIAAGGDGVGALADGRTVFVPRSAPGDLVELRQVVLAKRFARARIGRVVEPSPDRVEPTCPHYDRDDCGSCQLQHLSAPAQRAARQRLVGDALRRIGHLEVADPPIEASEAEFGYRTKITLTVGRGGRIGYHRLGRPDQVFDLTRCPIARPELNELWEGLRRQQERLPRNAERIVLRVDRSGACHVEADAEVVFEQVHPEMGDRVRRYAVEQLGALEGVRVWDLYAGIGETSEALAAAGAMVESVEVDPRAVRGGPSGGVRRIVGRVEDVIERLGPADAVIVNPPRTGLAETVTSRLAAEPPSRLVYVSCDPATLARDLARLRSTFRLEDVRAFDLFPQTAHVETVAVLVKV